MLISASVVYTWFRLRSVLRLRKSWSVCTEHRALSRSPNAFPLPVRNRRLREQQLLRGNLQTGGDPDGCRHS
jgi:hypothetical protein